MTDGWQTDNGQPWIPKAHMSTTWSDKLKSRATEQTQSVYGHSMIFCGKEEWTDRQINE